MDECIVDAVPVRHDPPSRQAIEQAKEKQLNALRQLRRLLMQVQTVGAN